MENKQHITVTTAVIPCNVELVDQRHLFRNSLESGAAEGKEKWGVKHTHMASAGARAYNGGLGAEPPAADEVFVFKTVIFNASATVFARNDVLFELLLL